MVKQKIAIVEEENERLREQWLEEQELCEAVTDFHVPNEDEDDHGQSTMANGSNVRRQG